jgi:hypothetical protein
MPGTNSYVRPRPQKLPPVQTLTGSADAITISKGDVFVLNRTGAVNAATLAAPTANTDDGRVILVINGTTQANTITIAAGLGTSGAGYTTLTMLNVPAANVTLRAYQGSWYMVGQYGITVS